MKTLIVTTPIRPEPTSFPPIGSLCLVNAIRRQGISEVEFYNIDGCRPSYDDVLAHIAKSKPDVLGISAVVSTAYAYTKRLSLDVKAMFPDCLVVVGGNLAASAEILLRKTGTDLCAIGEGENIIQEVVSRAMTTRNASDFKDIPGLALLDKDGQLVNTGYPQPLAKSELYDIDWDDLEKSSDINWYIFEPFDEDGQVSSWFKIDPRAYEPHRRGKRVGTLTGSKGCVARCTFCHRWDKGIRYIPVDILMQRIEELVERYNVGFLSMGNENFGSDRRWLKEFCQKIKKFDLLWQVSGMRVKSLSPEYLDMMKAAGCSAIFCGIETGSEKMLQIMEKKVKLEDNYNAFRWMVERGIHTTLQLILGMPGETIETVRETITFANYVTSLSPDQNPNIISTNYAQALPGTPLFEYGRQMGLIGRGLEEEEKYLLTISDMNASDEQDTLNFTAYPQLVCQMWRPMLRLECNYNFVKKYGIEQYHKVVANDVSWLDQRWKTIGYFTKAEGSSERHGIKPYFDTVKSRQHWPSLWVLIKSGKFNLAAMSYPGLAYRARHVLGIIILLKALRKSGPGKAWQLFSEYVLYKLGAFGAARVFKYDYISLRKILINKFEDLSEDDPAMVSLRKGR